MRDIPWAGSLRSQELSKTFGIAGGRSGDDYGVCCRGGISSQNRFIREREQDISLIDKAPGERKTEQENLLNRIFLEELLGTSGKSEERRLIYMRYFRDMTQTQVAEVLGISQVQVSRMEKRILEQLEKFA